MNIWSLLVLLLCFLAGAAAGSFIAKGQITQAATEAVLLDDGSVYGGAGFLGLLLSCSKYHIIVLVCATSILGVVLIPATVAVRGFVLACTAASIAASGAGNGILLTVVILGLPSLLTIPALFLLGCSGMGYSTKLLMLSEGGMSAPAAQKNNGSLLLCLAALILAAAVEYSIVPPLVKLLL